MVFVRYVLNQNTIWQTDFVTYSLVAATFIGSPYVLMTRGHVNVDVLPLYSGPRARFWLALFARPRHRVLRRRDDVLTVHVLARKPGTTAGCSEHDVARAAVDPVRVDADRAAACSPCSASLT